MRGRAIRPIMFAALLAPVAIVLGFLGYRAIPGQTLSTTDVLFRVMQLFVVEAVIPPEGTPWQLDVARFAAPLAVVYAAAVATLSLLRDRATRLRVSRFRGHVVVIGLGATGIEVAATLARRSSHGRRVRVVALEAVSTNAHISAARARGVNVLVGDGTGDVHLRRAGAHHARHVIALTGDDSRNLQVAGTARRLLAVHRVRATMHVAIGRAELWQELSRLQIGSGGSGVFTEYVHLADRVALRLLDEASALGLRHPAGSVLVDGDTAVAARVVTHVVRRAAATGARARVHLTTPLGSGELAPALSLTDPWCFDAAEIVRHQPGKLPGENEEVGLAFLCPGDDDAATVSRGLALARSLRGTKFVAAVYRNASEDLLESAGVRHDGLHLVAAKFDALGAELLQRSGVEVMARARHEEYVAGEARRGVVVADNASLVPWDRLPEALKDSNRRFAEGIGEVLRQMDASVVPLAGPVPEDIPIPGYVLEELAVKEHDRWMAALRADGWRPTTGRKDPDRKRHPLLVPWSDLPEAERDKDRDSFRALPAMLGQLGYQLALPEHSA